jgi:hypothetical protein
MLYVIVTCKLLFFILFYFILKIYQNMDQKLGSNRILKIIKFWLLVPDWKDCYKDRILDQPSFKKVKIGSSVLFRSEVFAL